MVIQSTISPLIQNSSSCILFPYDPYKCEVIIILRKVTASISFIGCIFMFSVMWLFRRYTSFAQKLILYLTIAAFLECFAYFVGGIHPDGPWCDFQAFYLTYFDWSVLLWVSCLTFNLYMNVVKSRQTSRYHIAYHILCWGLPILFSVTPLIGDHYGPAGAWCWIEDKYWAWRFGTWYGPLFFIIAIMFVVYGYLIYVIYKRTTRWEGTYDPDVERSKEMLKEDIKVLRFYPLIYFIIVLFPLINRIQNAVDPNNHVFAIVILSVIAAPLHGAANAVVFGLDKETTSKLTWTQIKMAFKSHTRITEVREYPDFRVSLDSGNMDASSPKYQSVAYSRLV